MGSEVQELSTLYTSPGSDVMSDCNYTDQAQYTNRTKASGAWERNLKINKGLGK